MLIFLSAILLSASSCMPASTAIVLKNSFSPYEQSEYSVTKRIYTNAQDTEGTVAAEGELSYAYSKTPEGKPVLNQSIILTHNGTVAYNLGKIDTMQSSVVFSNDSSRYFFPISYSKTMMISSKTKESDNSVNSYSITADFSEALTGKYTLYNKDGSVYTSDTVNAVNDFSYTQKNISSASGLNAYDNEQLFTIIRCMDKNTHFIPGKAMSFKISSLPNTIFDNKLTYYSVSASISDVIDYFDAPESLKDLPITDADNKIPCYKVTITIGTGSAITAWFSAFDTGAMNRILICVKQYTRNKEEPSSEMTYMLKNYIKDTSELF